MSAAPIIITISVILAIIAMSLIVYYGITKSKDKRRPGTKTKDNYTLPAALPATVKNIM